MMDWAVELPKAATICTAVCTIAAFIKWILVPIIEMRNAVKVNRCQNEEQEVLMGAQLNIALSMKASGYNHTIDDAINSLQSHLNAAAHKR